MILELDCGNSLLKWRVVSESALQVAAGLASSDEALLEDVLRTGLQIDACRLVSVRSDEETARLCRLLAEAFSVVPLCAQPALSLGGVRNGYEDYQRLGLDRWLALVGAYSVRRRACLVIDLGTAVTCDFVSADGMHLGGYICPGMPLMRSELRTHTRRIRYDDTAAERALHDIRPGVTTVQAVERGCLLMLRGFVEGQWALAEVHLGDVFDVYLTGGDADLVTAHLPEVQVVPDLVFRGLALACPLE